MSKKHPKATYEIQWEGESGNRRVEQVDADGYEAHHKPNSYLRMWVEDGEDFVDKFEIVGFNFTIRRVEDGDS